MYPELQIARGAGDAGHPHEQWCGGARVATAHPHHHKLEVFHCLRTLQAGGWGTEGGGWGGSPQG